MKSIFLVKRLCFKRKANKKVKRNLQPYAFSLFVMSIKLLSEIVNSKYANDFEIYRTKYVHILLFV